MECFGAEGQGGLDEWLDSFARCHLIDQGRRTLRKKQRLNKFLQREFLQLPLPHHFARSPAATGVAATTANSCFT